MPDGLPVLGPARACPDILYGFGHGHVGLVAAPRSAGILAAMLAGRPPEPDAAPYAPTRFR
jgi:D-amino-acid dehydrogenase